MSQEEQQQQQQNFQTQNFFAMCHKIIFLSGATKASMRYTKIPLDTFLTSLKVFFCICTKKHCNPFAINIKFNFKFWFHMNSV